MALESVKKEKLEAYLVGFATSVIWAGLVTAAKEQRGELERLVLGCWLCCRIVVMFIKAVERSVI